MITYNCYVVCRYKARSEQTDERRSNIVIFFFIKPLDSSGFDPTEFADQLRKRSVLSHFPVQPIRFEFVLPSVAMRVDYIGKKHAEESVWKCLNYCRAPSYFEVRCEANAGDDGRKL